MGNVSHKHHYVWRHYLGFWATGEQVWVRRRNGAVYAANVKDVAAQRHFNEVLPLGAADLEFLEWWMTPMDDSLKDVCRGWMPMFLVPQVIAKAVERHGTINDAARAELEGERIQLVERIYSRFEGGAVPLLDRLRHGDFSVLDDEATAIMLLFFIALQYFRTKRQRDAGLSVTRADPFRSRGVNADAVSGPLAWIHATGVGRSLATTRPHHEVQLLDAPDGVEFIGGDQPLLNRLPHDHPESAMQLYYPLGPRRALLLGVGVGTAGRLVRRAPREEVDALNREMLNESLEIVYGTSVAALRAV